MSARITYCIKVNSFTLTISDFFANAMHDNEVASNTSIIINNHRGIAFTHMRGKNNEQSTVPIPIVFVVGYAVSAVVETHKLEQR
eukprot:scaffold141300_cov27-Prasinocladus_malaysianus.AAC.1